MWRFLLDRADYRIGTPIFYCLVLHFIMFQFSPVFVALIVLVFGINAWWSTLRLIRDDKSHFTDRP